MREAVQFAEAQFGGGEASFEEPAAQPTPYVLCGDFNSFSQCDMDDQGWEAIVDLYAGKGWPPPRAESLVQEVLRGAGFVDAFALSPEAAPDPAAPSTRPPPTCWIRTRLDYVMLSPAAAAGREKLRVASHQTINSDASDHLCVVCDLEI